jgi:crossover junction endodeoxyribonuclease RuvC
LIVVGIDPGFSGGIATIYTNSNRQPSVWPMPTLPGPKGKTELNHHDILCALDFGGHRGVVWLEKVGARPGQGVSSMFRFGQQLGALEMAAIAKGHELRYVTPGVWKNYFGLAADKGVARGYAMKRFPDIAHMFSRVKDDGLAEACLIALYGTEHSK